MVKPRWTREAWTTYCALGWPEAWQDALYVREGTAVAKSMLTF